VPVILRVECAQGLLVCAPGGLRVAECVVGAAESERREREPGVGAQRAAKRDRCCRWLARFQDDEPLNEVRVGIKRGVRQQRRHAGQGAVAVTMVRRVQRGRQPLLARQRALPASGRRSSGPDRPACPAGRTPRRADGRSSRCRASAAPSISVPPGRNDPSSESITVETSGGLK
jgi:hypothetical protein